MTVLAGTRSYSILVVEENASDVFLLERALARQEIAFQLTHLRYAAQALAFVRRGAPYANSPRPDLILVDVSHARIDGECVIREVRNARHLDGVPVCAWFSAESLRDGESCERLRVDRLILKPSGLDQFMQIGKTVKDLLFGELGGPTPAFS